MAGIDEHIPLKALEEIYLPQFKAAVEQARAGAVMCAYNQVDGEFSCDSARLLGRLRRWGFDGVIVPDAASGFFERKIYHELVVRFRLGLYDRSGEGRAAAVVSTLAHRALAREIASSGAVLLKNAGSVLPLEHVSSIAVIGADAGPEAVVMESGSAHVHIGRLSIPIDAIRERAGSSVRVSYARGDLGVRPLPLIATTALSPSRSTPTRRGPGRRSGAERSRLRLAAFTDSR
jgi:beta-glucosidase